MSQFGHFSKDGTEYIFTDYQTKRPMLNYMWNASILSGVNHLGGGVGAYGGRAASYIDPDGKGRAIIIRNGNRYFYFRDEADGTFWNPGWYPARTPVTDYTCRHGLGYTAVRSTHGGVTAEVKGFVNAEDPVEIWTVQVTNTTGAEKAIKAYSFVEFSLEGYARYSEYDSYVRCEYVPEKRTIIAHNRAQERPHNWFDGFVSTDLEPSGFETSKRAFLGVYGDISTPRAVAEGRCGGSLAACEDMVGVFEHTLTLKAGETCTYHFLIGAADGTETALRLSDKIFAPGKIEADFAALQAEKKAMTQDIMVETPSEKVNCITNMWVKQQVQLCAEVGRATGKGFRDQLQDAWAVAAFNPALAREKILEVLQHEYSDGRCVRGWLPLDPHIYSDGPVWIAPTINAYIKETGDTAFLDCRVPYLDEGEDTVWEHMLTAVRYSSEDLGQHGLVLAHDGDWNDSLNGIGVGGKGESVWTSIALCVALDNMAEIVGAIKKDETIKAEMLERADRMKKAINENGWDGEWYLAGYTDAGAPVGSHTEEEGKIYLNSQTWAVLAGVAEGDRLTACLRSVDTYLDSPYGPLTLYPPYTSYRPEIGRLTGFVPGIWENGTPYCHGGTFKLVADCYAGRGQQAYDTLMKIMPDSKSNPSEHSGCEPYVFTNMYFGPDNPRAGETSFAWVTGTAGWMFRSVTQYMMGFYPGYADITIKPCIPPQWKKCSMRRVFRGDTYEITIHNEGTGMQLTVDGKAIDGNTFPLFGDGAVHRIEVIL